MTFSRWWILALFIAVLYCPEIILADDEESEEEKQAWYEDIESQWGGHIRGGGSIGRHQKDSLYLIHGENPFLDAFLENRFKNKTFWTDWFYTDIHYELVYSGFDSRSAEQKIRRELGEFTGGLAGSGGINDQRRLFDLTGNISSSDCHRFYHRLDRASLSFSPSWGLIRLGRQTVTWGNGFLFNPMDLFNPFAPSDIIRDYKIGDDMALLQTSFPSAGEFQLLYVPRRNLSSGNVEWDSSSLGGKLHLARGTVEFDAMAAHHYEDFVIGGGSRGYLGYAAWRIDATYTFLNSPDSTRSGYLSMVANLDYSWIWGGKNFYGFVETYYNGLGSNHYGSALFEPKLAKRVARGELFTLGKVYLSGSINMEVHPLFNLFVTSINNLQDPSGLIQPYAVADLKQNLQLTVGANISFGDISTEYGGFYLPGSDFLVDPAESVYLWITYYF